MTPLTPDTVQPGSEPEEFSPQWFIELRKNLSHRLQSELEINILELPNISALEAQMDTLGAGSPFIHKAFAFFTTNPSIDDEETFQICQIIADETSFNVDENYVPHPEPMLLPIKSIVYGLRRAENSMRITIFTIRQDTSRNPNGPKLILAVTLSSLNIPSHN